MNTLLARYLDGDLGEDEARAFRETLARDAALAEELHALEAALNRYREARCRLPARGFADRVMAALPPAPPRRASAERRAWRSVRAWALAASLVACLGLGWIAGRYGAASGPRPTGITTGPAAPESALRLVRLVHVPADPAVRSVAVAGDFNGWDAGATPMHRAGAVWVVSLMLPADEYEYVFVENGGERWVVDELAGRTRDDGFGSENAVLDLRL